MTVQCPVCRKSRERKWVKSLSVLCASCAGKHKASIDRTRQLGHCVRTTAAIVDSLRHSANHGLAPDSLQRQIERMSYEVGLLAESIQMAYQEPIARPSDWETTTV